MEKNEGYVYKNLLDKRKKIKPKYEIGDLVRTVDLKKNVFKRRYNYLSYKFYKITETINDTIPSNKIDSLSERYNESLLKKTKLTLQENDIVMKKLIIT